MELRISAHIGRRTSDLTNHYWDQKQTKNVDRSLSVQLAVCPASNSLSLPSFQRQWNDILKNVSKGLCLKTVTMRLKMRQIQCVGMAEPIEGQGRLVILATVSKAGTVFLKWKALLACHLRQESKYGSSFTPLWSSSFSHSPNGFLLSMSTAVPPLHPQPLPSFTGAVAS